MVLFKQRPPVIGMSLSNVYVCVCVCVRVRAYMHVLYVYYVCVYALKLSMINGRLWRGERVVDENSVIILWTKRKRKKELRSQHSIVFMCAVWSYFIPSHLTRILPCKSWVNIHRHLLCSQIMPHFTSRFSVIGCVSHKHNTLTVCISIYLCLKNTCTCTMNDQRNRTQASTQNSFMFLIPTPWM